MNQVEKENDFEFDFAMCHGSYDGVNEDKKPYYCCIL